MRRRLFGKGQRYHDVFDSEVGRYVLGDLLRRSGCYEGSYIQGDTHGTAFQEGQRAMGLYVANLVNLDEKRLQAMIQRAEQLDRDAASLETGGLYE